MKKISLLFLSLLLLSCGEKKPTAEEVIASGDEKAIAMMKSDLLTQKAALSKEIELIEAHQKNNGEQAMLSQVTVLKVTDTIYNHYVALQGNVETKQNVLITPEMPGLLTRVYVKEGQRVSKGQLLASIDDGGLSQQLQQLQVQANLAQTTYERQKRLWEQQIGSEIQYLQAKTGYEAQQKAIQSMQKQLAKTKVKAPFSGVIDDVITEQGNVVSPGVSQLMRLVNLSDMYVKVEVPENYLGSIKTGTIAKVELPSLGKVLDSKVRQTGSYINPANRSYAVEIGLPNKDKNIKPNLTAKLMLNDYSTNNAKLIPLSVINEDQNGDQYVMVAMDKDGASIAIRKTIKTGKTSGDLIEVVEGLEVNDQVIVEGARSVKENQKVNILS